MTKKVVGDNVFVRRCVKYPVLARFSASILKAGVGMLGNSVSTAWREH
jgi:hypothetical protein